VRDPVEEGHDEVDAGAQNRAKPAEAFDNMLFGLRHDPHAKEDAKDDKGRNGQKDGVAADKIVRAHS